MCGKRESETTKLLRCSRCVDVRARVSVCTNLYVSVRASAYAYVHMSFDTLMWLFLFTIVELYNDTVNLVC